MSRPVSPFREKLAVGVLITVLGASILGFARYVQDKADASDVTALGTKIDALGVKVDALTTQTDSLRITLKTREGK